MPAPSSFARVSEWSLIQSKLKSKGIQLNVHRPAEMCSSDITLFYDLFVNVSHCH